MRRNPDTMPHATHLQSYPLITLGLTYIFSKLNCRLRSYGSRKLSDEKHSPDADARNPIGGVRAGLGPRIEALFAAGWVEGKSNGSGLLESVRLERNAIGRRGSAENATMPFQQVKTGTGDSVCIA